MKIRQIYDFMSQVNREVVVQETIKEKEQRIEKLCKNYFKNKRLNENEFKTVYNAIRIYAQSQKESYMNLYDVLEILIKL